MNDVDELIGHIERQIETLCNRMTGPVTSKSAADINDVARKHWESNVAILDKLYQVRAKRFGIIEPDHKADTAVIPPETIAKANTDSAFIGGLTHEKGTGYPIVQEFASGGTITPPTMVTMDISAIDKKSFKEYLAESKTRDAIKIAVESSFRAPNVTKIDAESEPLKGQFDDESKRIAEAVASTPHTC